MAEPSAAPDENPFGQFNSELPAGAPPPAKAPAKPPEPEVNPLAKFNSERPHDEPPPTTATGTFLHGAERGVLPAIGSLPAIGAGAELGSGLGLLGGPLAPVTEPAGIILGGLAGGFLGSTAIAKAQDWGLSKLPDSWREAIGLDERQEKLEQGEHPIASFLGGIAPFALTMRPGGISKVALPENATAMQRIMAHPATARIFGGAAMGGIELGQEAAEGEHPDWTKVAISTGFGLVFNKPTRFGEALTEVGARPARAVMGVPSPTVIQASDANVIGPGVTEDVHQGAHERDPTAAMTAQQGARDEQAVMGTALPERNVAEAARKHAPEAFALWDDLHAREVMLRQWDRGPETVPHIAEHLRDTREQIAELAPEIQGAYRRAAEAIGAVTVGPGEGAERFPNMAAMLAAQGGEAAPARPPEAAGVPPLAPPAKPIAEQRATIAADVQRQLLAAGYNPEWSAQTAQIQAARYIARAQRLGLDPETLYRQQAPSFVGRRQTPPAPTEPGAPATPRPPTPAAATIDATHDVVSGANSSKEPSGPVYIDRRIPELSPILKDRNGQPANLHKYLAKHETDEAQAMREGQPYDAAHKRATAAERAAVEADGVDWKAYTEEMDGYLDHIEHEKAENPPPGALHVDPQQAIGHHRGANKQPSAPKPAEAPIAPAEVAAPRPEAPAGAQVHPEEPEFEPAAPVSRRGPSAQPEERRSLLPFIAGRGGIRSDDPMISDLRAEIGIETNHFVPGHGMLIRPYAQVSTAARRGGRQPPMTIDTARELAVDSGYLPQGATINDFLKALGEDRNRRKVYRMGEGAREREAEPGEIEKAKDDLLADIDDLVKADGGSPLTKQERARAVELWEKEGLNEAPEILERLSLEFSDEAIDGGATNGEEPVAVPGWDDAAHPGTIEGAGGVVPAVPGAEGAAGGAVRGAGGEGAGAAPAADEFEREYFQRRRTERDLMQEDARSLAQTRMGKVTLREGQRPVITLFRNADASTAIHELGHTYLEELMEDAEHPNAGPDLKGDAQTVLGWLKVPAADSIEARHHEKFARGFEQYMREGVAPSPELASVFAKFRDWLLRIYQSVRDLIRRPEHEINPDIRAVFERMLSAAPQHTVIAPEVAKRPTLADIHEADAHETEPHEAEPVMDRVVAEAERQEAAPPPGTEHEIAAAEAQRAAAAAGEPPGEAGTRPAEGREISRPGEQPGPIVAGGAVGAEPGAQLPGGGNARAESKPVSGAERPSAAGDLGAGLGDKPLAPRPGPLFGAAESPHIDRAGNIRLDTLTTREDVRDAIRAAAAENQDFIGDRRGVMTDGQVMDLATDIGMVGAEAMLKQRLLGQAFNAEQITAARKLLIQSAAEVSAAMKKAATGTDEDVMAYAQAKDRHQLIQAQIAGITAEAGRALRAFRDISGSKEAKSVDQFIREATGKTLFQLRQEARLGAELQTPQQVSKFMQDAQKRTFGRMILEYWINGLISGPATHVTYAIGNNILALQKAGPETAAAALVGSIRRAMGREGDTVRIGEVAAQLKAAGRGIAPALKAAADAFRTGVTTALPGEHETNLLPFQEFAPLGQPAAMDEAANLHDAFTAAFGIMRGVRDGFRAGGGIATEAPMVGLRYSHLGVIPDVEIAGMNLLPVGTAVRLPGRFIAAIHSFYRATNYSMDKAAIAYRTAANEGLRSNAFDARVGDLMQNPPEAMMAQARGVATELTLMGQGGEFTKALSRLTNAPIFGFPVFKFIDPFVKISSAIIEQALVERTPIGILSPEIRADLSGKNGTVAQDTATARMLVGTAYALAIGGLAAEGYISGSGPSDPRQAAIWRLAGNQAHSVRIGDTWHDVHRLGPMGMLMGVAADLYEVAHKASDGDMLTAAATLQHAITQNILDESFMRGPSDLIKAIDDPGRYGEAYIRNTLSSFVPYSVGMAQMARATDPYSRQARSVLDAIKAKIPGLSESLLPRRDIWGEPMPSREALLAPGVTAIYETRMSRDPVNLALNDLGLHPGAVERKIRGVQLTDDQYDDFARIAGRMTKMRLDVFVRSPDWRSWPNHVKRDVITAELKASREAARGMLMMKYPQIVNDALKARLDKLKD